MDSNEPITEVPYEVIEKNFQGSFGNTDTKKPGKRSKRKQVQVI